jgi:hypothetical protein
MFGGSALNVCFSGFAECVLDKEGFHEKKRKIGLIAPPIDPIERSQGGPPAAALATRAGGRAFAADERNDRGCG